VMEMNELKPGLVGEASEVVTEQNTAARWGSGLVAAYATPAMIALMESASVTAIRENLEEGETSVGIEVNVKHLAPTPIGMRVRSRAELLAVDGHRVMFTVEAWDEKEKVGEGTHVRVIIDAARFAERLKQKTTSK